MKQPGIYKIKDGLHELGVMGQKGDDRSNVMRRFLGGYERIIHTNVHRMLRKLSITMFLEHSHLTFSERFCASWAGIFLSPKHKFRVSVWVKICDI